ncbi:MAG: site-specific DNA-methyltransferase [Sphingobacteriales bacterium]|nr:MAG: site-specific DNA-methyltransferase [Sphingobacteriales bacterium]
MAKKIESIKYNNDKRAHIPSKEEAGYEEVSPKVQQGKKTLELPKNPVVHRGQDPELFWLNKYDNDDRENLLRVDIRSLYRHEHIAPETLIKNLYKLIEPPSNQMDLFSANELFGNALDKDELEKVSQYYQHQDGWTNRLIQGDSQLVMASLLEREGMAGKVQTIYFDPPYGIKYGSNWQVKLNNRDVKDGNDEALTGEPEQIKAFRDTWELGIHSYLSYLRDRLLIAKELLTESGSCFVQISDENVHLVRSIMDEVFGSENFIVTINVQKTGGLPGKYLTGTVDYIIWYSKNKDNVKYRQLYLKREIGDTSLDRYDMLMFNDGTTRRMKPEEIKTGVFPENGKRYQLGALYSDGAASYDQSFEFKGGIYKPRSGKHWSTHLDGMQKLANKNRIEIMGSVLRYRRFVDDFNFVPITDRWDAVQLGTQKLYVVQTSEKAIQRCILMSTDPGDLILDPTCGSGTTAFVAEQWGRRWITIDTSRIALNISKQRLMTSVFPYYKLYDETSDDIRQGFIYKTVPHITLKSLANDEPPATETLYDRPEIDNKKLRVSGPFTVETLQNFEPTAPEELEEEAKSAEDATVFEETVKQHLVSAGIKNGRKDEQVVFSRVELLSHPYLHAEGFYMNGTGEKKAYIHIGPKFGTVSKNAVNEAVKECRLRGDAQWLIILGFSFESDIEGTTQTMNMGKFEVTKARIHDDLMQDGLKKKPGKSAASFVTIGELDIALYKDGKTVSVEIQGLDIYDPIKDEVKARNVSDIAYWMVDDDYDGSNFIVKQVFFCGGDKDEFDKWKKGLESLAKDSTKKKVEKTLKIEIDDEAFDRLYGHISHPIEVKKQGQKIAVRVISQFGEETTKVLTV